MCLQNSLSLVSVPSCLLWVVQNYIQVKYYFIFSLKIISTFLTFQEVFFFFFRSYKLSFLLKELYGSYITWEKDFESQKFWNQSPWRLYHLPIYQNSFSTSCSSNNVVLCTKVFKVIRNKVISMVNINLTETKVTLALNITF